MDGETIEMLNKEHLDFVREQRLKRKKTISFLREVCLYLFFIWILFLVSYMNKDINSFSYNNQIKKILGISPSNNTLAKVKKISFIFFTKNRVISNTAIFILIISFANQQISGHGQMAYLQAQWLV